MAADTSNDRNSNSDKAAREERLAAKLRENLRRRKRQSRALDARGTRNADDARNTKPSTTLPNGEEDG